MESAGGEQYVELVLLEEVGADEEMGRCVVDDQKLVLELVIVVVDGSVGVAENGDGIAAKVRHEASVVWLEREIQLMS